MTTQEHLDWLLYLMAEYPESWKQHCWRRAKEIAQDPEHAELPQLLQQAMRAVQSKPMPSEPQSSD